MKGNNHFAKYSNFLLITVITFIASVCFFPVATTASAEPRVYRQGNPSGKGVSLLVNVYEGERQVDEMLDILKEYGGKATFFVGGCWADDHVSTLQKIVKEGHELGSHGYFHKDCSKLGYAEQKEEITLSTKLILQATGVRATLFAPPSGDYDDTTVKLCEEENLKLVLWSKDTVDWRDQDENKTFSRATDGLVGGDFVLMHPKQSTVKALPNILRFYRDNGFKAVTVTQNITYIGES